MEGARMEELVKDLRKLMRFKATTGEGDIVLVAMEKNHSLLYALVTRIERDVSRRDEWWHVTLHILGVPPQKVVWTLREPQFTGAEMFTMGGDGRFMAAVDFRDGDESASRPKKQRKEPSTQPRQRTSGSSPLRVVK